MHINGGCHCGCITCEAEVVRTGTARQRSELRPRRQIWCQSSQEWLTDLQSITQFAKQPA